MRLLTALLALCAASLAHADVLADLKNTLAKLDARESLTANVLYEFTTRSGDDDEPKIEEGRATAQVTDEAKGLTIVWSREQIDAAAAEARAADESSGKKSASRRAMDGLNVTTLSDYLNAAPKLLRLLSQSALIEEKTSSWSGQPARLITLKVTPQKSPKEIKEFECIAKLWVDAAGIPLAAESRTHAKGRAMLVVGFEVKEFEEWRFKRVDQRLVTTQHKKETQQSGGGQKSLRNSTATLTVADH